MKKQAITFLVFVYIVIGAIIAFADIYVLPIYLTLLPFHGFMLYQSIKTKNIFFVLFCLLLFISYGIGSIPFYLDRDNANWRGFNAIGDFDFSYHSLFLSYSHMVLFLIVLWVFVALFRKKTHSNFLPSFLKEQYNVLQSQSTIKTSIPILCLIGLFLYISIWMYNSHIGMIGLHQTELPYHLTGALFYSRRFLFPIVLVWIFVKTESKVTASIALIFYSLVVGVLATSKSAALIVLVPLAFLNHMMGKKTLTWVCIVSSVIIYFIIGELRTIVYEADADIDWVSLFSTPLDFSQGDRNLWLYLANNFTNRLYGLQSTVLGYQYRQLSLQDLLGFYFQGELNIPDYVPTLFGIDLPEDKAFGVGLGYAGTFHLLSGRNYFFTILQAFFVSIIFCFQNNCIQKVFGSSCPVFYKYAALLLLFFSFMKFYDGYEIELVYLAALLLFIVSRLSSSRGRTTTAKSYL